MIDTTRPIQHHKYQPQHQHQHQHQQYQHRYQVLISSTTIRYAHPAYHYHNPQQEQEAAAATNNSNNNKKMAAHFNLRFTIAFVAMTASHLVLGWAPAVPSPPSSSSSKSSSKSKSNKSFQKKYRYPSAVLLTTPPPLQEPRTVALHSSSSSTTTSSSSSSSNESDNSDNDDRPLAAGVGVCFLDRRTVLATFISTTFALSNASPALAATTTSSSSTTTSTSTASAAAKPQEFTNISTQAPPPPADDGSGGGETSTTTPFRRLPSGVQIKDFRVGSAGEATVTPNSKQTIAIQCSGRLLNLNGLVFYNTKNNNPDGFGAIPLTVDLGQGQMLPGLEEGLVGMKKGGIRRIIVPQQLAYNYNANALFPNYLEPRPMTSADQRALDSVVKNSRRDGTILFDVQVERLK